MNTKLRLMIIIIFFVNLSISQSNYPYKTILEIQYKPIDSLLLADTIQNSIPSRWTLQSSNFLGDTVRIVGVCVIPPKTLTYTTFGYNMVVADTGYQGPFGYIFIRPPISSAVNPGDTVYYQSILNVDRGDVIEIVGKVWDFPGPGESGYPTMNSMSQIIPLRDPNFTKLEQGRNVPPPIKMEVSDFYEGLFPDGKIKFSSGEPFESGYVELTNLTVVSWLNTTNGTVNLIDDNGNMISTYDASKWWTLRAFRDPNSPYTSIFPIGTKIHRIKGWITTVSGAENPRGYRICPIFPDDIDTALNIPQLIYPLNNSINIPLSLNLRWTYRLINTIFNLQISSDSLFSNIIFNDSSVIDTFKYIDGLSNSTTYYWKVGIKDSNNKWFYSDVWKFKTIPSIPDAPKLSFPPNGSSRLSNNITLVWYHVKDAEQYHLQIATDHFFENIILEDSSIYDNFKNIKLSGSIKTYYWRVRAKNFSGFGNYSTIWNFSSLISPPFNLKVSAKNKEIKLDWEHGSINLVSHFNIYRKIGYSNYQLIDTISQPFCVYIDKNLLNGVQYYYKVTAVDTFLEESEFSNEVNAIPFNIPPIAKKLNDIIIENSGRKLIDTLYFSSEGSYDLDGRVDSIYWYINNSLISKDPILIYGFGPGISFVKLVVLDNDNAKDSSFAIVKRSTFLIRTNGEIYAGVSSIGNNILYAISKGDAIYRLDTNGTIIFTLQVGGNILSASSISFDTTIFIGSTDKNLYAFSKYGTSLWPALPLGGEILSTPTIDSLSDRIYLGLKNRNFIAINKSTGLPAWNYFADAPIISSAVITSDRKLIFTTIRGTIYGFKLSNISSKPEPDWIYSVNDSVFSSLALDNDDNFYLGTKSGKVMKFSISDNNVIQKLWEVQTNGKIFAAPVISKNGILYIGSTDSILYAIHTNNGNIFWTFSTKGEIRSTAAISNTNVIYFGNDAGEFLAIDTLGNIKWKYISNSPIRSPILYNNGCVYLGDLNGYIYAFYDDESRGNANDLHPWSTFQGNNSRTGVQLSRLSTNNLLSLNISPSKYMLEQNYPNPFNSTTIINFSIPTSSFVSLKVFNILGQEIATLLNEEKMTGTYSIKFDAKDLNSGIYFYRLTTDKYSYTKKFILMR